MRKVEPEVQASCRGTGNQSGSGPMGDSRSRRLDGASATFKGEGAKPHLG